ncbi:Bromodomain-containing protein 8 [Harpegnathos saltator]|uniref:Bromodomain-containing protein 8 n=2 Tax=Harpegnathos saltator TaxID=610380 RepID=E2BKZ4_HARSA|nr:Bromodomain-containing protein 8 [Harpegnathos saltator]
MPRRKKRENGETTSEFIVRRLTQERISELNQILGFQKDEYLRHKADMNLLKSGMIINEKLEKMWLDIQKEEHEEQKVRTQSVWIAKRQQKQQEINLPTISSVIGNQCKIVENTVVETQESPTESLAEDDEKKNRGGRSPLLTSLLKSPSPTTQTQTTTSTFVQSNSPTITSLLGSSSKIMNTQLTQNVSPQLQQLVSTAIASTTKATLERPSVGAPTLSMLLEMPASSQRGSLPNLQAVSTATIITSQSTQQVTVATTDVHNFPQTQQAQNVHHQMPIQDVEATPTILPNTIPTTNNQTTNNIPISENMVQIIDHIDDVIRKDIMTDVMDKDEINEIIGDIEELIKEEITAHSPQTLQDTSGSSTSTTATVIDTLTVQTSPQVAEIPVVVTMEPRPEPRDVDETISLSNSPQSEMAIEEIDSSTSNIAEIIGTVAIEPQEPKIIITEVTETMSNTLEETKSEISTCDERIILTEEFVPEQESSDGENDKEDIVGEKHLSVENKFLNTTLNVVEREENEQDELLDSKKMIEEAVNVKKEEKVEEENEREDEEMEMIIPNDKNANESTKERKEILKDIESKNNVGLDQLEMHLAKITGDQQDVLSTEVTNMSSEITNDLPNTEDTEKSQDISLILEDDEERESSRNSESKKKTTLEQIIENTIKSTTESLESFKEEIVVSIKKEEIIVEVREESSVKSQEEKTVEGTLQVYTEEFKKEEEEIVKDSLKNSSSILQDIKIKEKEIEQVDGIGDVTINTITIENIQSIKSEPTVAVNIENVSVKKTESMEVKLEEPKTEREVKIPIDVLQEEDRNENVEVKEEKKEKEDTKKGTDEQNVKKEIESEMTSAGEDTGELDEEESSLSKLSSGRAMKTYSKRQQNIAVDSEPENEGTGEGADYRAWKKAVMLVYNRLATHKYASIFLRPITEDQAPGYHTVIFRPMDLSTIKKNIDNGTIRSTMHFQRDVMLMFQNAIMYNKHDTFVYKMAVSMQEECLQHMQILVQVTGEGTFRRETRTATASSSSETSENNIKRKRSHITPSPHDTDSLRSKKRRKSEND